MAAPEPKEQLFGNCRAHRQLFAVQEFSMQLTATFVVALFLCLLQWYVLRRMLRLPQ